MNPSDGPFANAIRNFKQLRHSPGSWTWVAVIVGIELLIVCLGGPEKQPARSWYEWLGLNREGFLSGKIWQVFTYGLLHGGWWHALLNALCILLVGSRIEHMTGTPAMVKTTVFGILGGGIGHLLLAPGGPRAALLVGISGGVMALFLMLTTLSPQSRMMPLWLSGRSLGAGILAVALALVLIHPDLSLPGFSTVGMALRRAGWGMIFDMGHACHFGGGLAGWLYGRWLLRPRITLERLRRDRQRREASEARRAG